MRQQFWLRLATLSVLGMFLLSARAQVSNVRLNEVLANNTLRTNADGSITDLLEFYNSGTMNVDLVGCSLSDSNAFPLRYVFPAGSIVPAGGYRTMIFDSAHTNQPLTAVPFGIKGSGGFLYFFTPSGTTNDYVEYGLQPADYSIGRVDATTNWYLITPSPGATNVAVALGEHSALRVNEWMADESSGSDWFEIFNTTNKPVSLSDLYLTDAIANPTQVRIPSLSFIGAGGTSGYAVFSADGALTKYPADHVFFKLNNTAESIIIIETNAAVIIDQISYSGYTSANNKDVSEGRLPDGGTNRVFFRKINGYDTVSQGTPNFLILTNIIVNELLSHTDLPLEDAVEVQNRATTNINISGWWVSNSRLNRQRYQIPNGTTLPPGGFRVIYEGTGATIGFNSTNAADPFTFNSAHGDNVVISQVDASGNLTGYLIYEEFESAANSVSFGHYDTTVAGDYKFVAMSARSFGQDDPLTLQEYRSGTGLTNPFPKVGPVSINEVMFAPSNTTYVNTNMVTVFGQNPDEEFIELRNVSGTNVFLYDPQYPTNHWRLQKAISFVFPQTNLPPNTFCLVVGFNPYSNISALTNFRSRYGISNTVPIFGPWAGALNNSGDSIELYRPDPVQLPPHPDAGFVPYIRVDKVNYDTKAPWPGFVAQGVALNDGGKSLQRKNSSIFGNDPINWALALPTAGFVSQALQDTDGDGIPDAWETAHGLNPNTAADALLDPDGDSVNNLGEYLSGTDPQNAASVLRVQGFIPFIGTNVPAYIRFLAYSNTTYTVEYRNSLLPESAWQKLADVPSASTNRFVEVPDPNAYKKTDRYYRLAAPATN